MIVEAISALALLVPNDQPSGPWVPYTFTQQQCASLLYYAQNVWDGSSAWPDGKLHFPPECGISPVGPHSSRLARMF